MCSITTCGSIFYLIFISDEFDEDDDVTFEDQVKEIEEQERIHLQDKIFRLEQAKKRKIDFLESTGQYQPDRVRNIRRALAKTKSLAFKASSEKTTLLSQSIQLHEVSL